MQWQIEWMRTTPETAALPHCVIEAAYKVTHSDAEHTVMVCGTVCFDAPGQSYIPYQNLTESAVLSWIWAVIDRENIESAILERLENQKSPLTVQPSLPWVAT